MLKKTKKEGAQPKPRPAGLKAGEKWWARTSEGVQTFKQFISEVPIPQDWDQEVYTPKTSFAAKVRYAQERAKKLGAGSARVVFNIEHEGRQTALKIAKNPKGLAQNSKEADYGLYRMYPDITTPLIDYDEKHEEPIWIHLERADKLRKPQFKSITGYSFDDFADLLQADEARRNGRNYSVSHIDADQIELIEESELYQETTSLMGNFDILAGDLTRTANWGVYKGRPVIVDLGFRPDVRASHYS